MSSQSPVSPRLQGQPLSEDQTVTAIVSLMAVGASVELLTPKIQALLRPLGIPGDATALAVKIAMAAPINSRQATRLDTPAVKTTVLTERTFRATYILNASRRIAQAQKERQPASQILNEERRWFAAHRQNADRRHQKAKEVDVAAERYGDTLGWYAKRDSRTSAECLAAHGKNFNANNRPLIGFPGTVHPHCRCRPGPPHANASLLTSRKVA